MMKISADQYWIELTFFSIEEHFAVIETVRVIYAWTCCASFSENLITQKVIPT